jgi:hypothetical protein
MTRAAIRARIRGNMSSHIKLFDNALDSEFQPTLEFMRSPLLILHLTSAQLYLSVFTNLLVYCVHSKLSLQDYA